MMVFMPWVDRSDRGYEAIVGVTCPPRAIRAPLQLQSMPARVVPKDLASLLAVTMEGVLSALSMAPTYSRCIPHDSASRFTT